MKNHGRQRSTVRPPTVEVTETRVFTYSDIRPIEQPDFTGYEFNMTEYTKDEYIQYQATQNAAIAETFTYLPLDIQAEMIENQTNQLLKSQEDLK